MRISATALALAALLTLSGCGGSPRGAADNVLRININVEVADLDPQLVTGVAEHRVNAALFEGLTDLDPATYEPIPGAAESWDVSEDQLTYTFRLRQDGKWSNGDPVTANDFHYSFKRILSPGLAAPYAYLLHCVKNARAFNAGEIASFDEVGVKVIDDYTLEITLDHPTPYFLALHMHQAWFPVHQPTIEKHGAMDQRGTPWTRAGNHVGNGPFRLTDWRPNEIIRVARNDHYWNRDTVRLDGIEFYPIDNLTTEERSFRSGKIQLTGDVHIDKIPVYQAENPDLIHIDPYFGTYFYRLNTTRKPFDDPRVRHAFSLALNREVLTQNVLKGGETPAFHFVPPGVPDYTSDAPLAYDPDKARALLAEAGYPNGQGLPAMEILYNTSESHKRIAEAIQQMWKKELNAEVRLLNQDWKVYQDTTKKLNYDLARAGWIGDVVDPMNFLELWQTNGGNNDTGYANPAYDALIEQAYNEPDRAARLALLKRAENLMLEDLPVIPIYFYTRKYLQAPEVKGYVPNVLGYLRFQEFYLERETAAP
ncbi:MAG: peptide ABC transporter substrate-binding protein [Candidatus Hydrogenedentes bacterium]|nr:peptide ABC transporter substrate-binding protein [Candidatus Hydrogenedentota bacterium]